MDSRWWKVFPKILQISWKQWNTIVEPGHALVVKVCLKTVNLRIGEKFAATDEAHRQQETTFMDWVNNGNPKVSVMGRIILTGILGLQAAFLRETVTLAAATKQAASAPVEFLLRFSTPERLLSLCLMTAEKPTPSHHLESLVVFKYKVLLLQDQVQICIYAVLMEHLNCLKTRYDCKKAEEKRTWTHIQTEGANLGEKSWHFVPRGPTSRLPTSKTAWTPERKKHEEAVVSVLCFSAPKCTFAVSDEW